MSNVAIEVEQLGKSYRVQQQRERYEMLSNKISRFARNPARAMRNGRAARDANLFWALDEIDFEVHQGEVVGLIGHNGAGKSTLLKVLARITEPTRGSVTMRGRVGSLLEVGTGFHVELTGRENVYLSGAILGMKYEEIRRNFDEIIAFAEVERFIDTAVKHYSSGMQLRLAFSVAAHLQPEILLIDEVLAVGDMRFQRKCLGKMEDVAAAGRTVLFVSHNLSAVKELCQTSVVLERGRVTFRGTAAEGIAHYTSAVASREAENAHGGGWSGLTPRGGQAEDVWRIAPGEPLSFTARLNLPESMESGWLFVVIEDASGTTVVHQRIELSELQLGSLPAGTHEVSGVLPPLWLAPGLYNVHLKLVAHSVRDEDVKYVSERRLLDVHGWSNTHANALLAPSCAWTLETAGA